MVKDRSTVGIVVMAIGVVAKPLMRLDAIYNLLLYCTNRPPELVLTTPAESSILHCR